jgi:hypothetical protein
MGQMGTSTSKRGYGNGHQRLRRDLLPLSYGKPCPFCGYAMVEGQKLDLDHSIPLRMGGGGPSRMAHARCNRRAGAVLAAAIRRGRRAASRSW